MDYRIDPDVSEAEVAMDLRTKDTRVQAFVTEDLRDQWEPLRSVRPMGDLQERRL